MVFDWGKINEKINYIADSSIRTDLNNFVKDIINITSSNDIIIKTRKNKCDIEWLYNGRIFIFIACRKTFYHFAIFENYSSIPEFPKCQYEKDDDTGYIRMKLRVLSSPQKDEILELIKNRLKK